MARRDPLQAESSSELVGSFWSSLVRKEAGEDPDIELRADGRHGFYEWRQVNANTKKQPDGEWRGGHASQAGALKWARACIADRATWDAQKRPKR